MWWWGFVLRAQGHILFFFCFSSHHFVRCALFFFCTKKEKKKRVPETEAHGNSDRRTYVERYICGHGNRTAPQCSRVPTQAQYTRSKTEHEHRLPFRTAREKSLTPREERSAVFGARSSFRGSRAARE